MLLKRVESANGCLFEQIIKESRPDFYFDLSGHRINVTQTYLLVKEVVKDLESWDAPAIGVDILKEIKKSLSYHTPINNVQEIIKRLAIFATILITYAQLKKDKLCNHLLQWWSSDLCIHHSLWLDVIFPQE